MINKITILWADDEIDLLKPHILFLQEKGYEVTAAKSGNEAIELLQHQTYDVIFLDEQMPGLSGIETLSRIKNSFSDVPVVMITKSEEETIMEEAIGSKIADYLIKPVNPNQILLSLKKILENKRLVSEKTTSQYQQEFRSIGMQLNEKQDADSWKEIYKKIVFWELALDKSGDKSMSEMLDMQKQDANTGFCKFIEANYLQWLSSSSAPLLSHTVLKNKLAPLLEKQNPVFLLVIDNLRYDQWKTIQPKIAELFSIQEELLYYSILPTVTQFARNALFAGLMPSEIAKIRPDLWRDEKEEGSKNQFEAELFSAQLKGWGMGDMKHSYHKILNMAEGKKLADTISNLLQNKLNIIVYNFVDMLSHARTEMEVIRELADDESAYRSLTLSWFEHSPLQEMLKQIADKKATLIITTDHGSIRVHEPTKVIGEKGITTNLRYKQGKSLSYEKRDVMEVRNPDDAFLPKANFTGSYIFAKQNKFFAYPNNYNHYANYYRNTIQHGGISLEEMLIPFVILQPK
jgi:CheY-like chemotaxis protein